MVLQAKLERRQRRQSEKSGKINEESRSMLGSTDDITAGHPQSIPPPSEPVLPAGNKVLSPKDANSTTTSTQMLHETVHLHETVPEHDLHAQFTEDKSEARHSATLQKGEVTYIHSIYNTQHIQAKLESEAWVWELFLVDHGIKIK